jgi:hypothetical protein
MQPKTLTTLGELRIGDRFHYPKRVDPWQLVKFEKNKVHVNQFAAHVPEKPLHKYDDVKAATTPVIFLRHTQEGLFAKDELTGKV